jgi:carboxymethylenebutenolidase
MGVLTRPEGSEPEDFHLSRRLLGGVMFAGYALAAGPLRADPIVTDTKGLFAQAVEIPSHGVKLPGYLAMPADAKNRPVIVVISEIFGLHEHIRDLCRRLAHQGYVAIAPDLFARAGNPAAMTMEQISDIMKVVATATDKQVMGDIEATLDFLGSKPRLGQKHADFADLKRVGVTGFCWGGAVVWMALAEVSRVKSGVAWYGRLAPPAKPTEDRKWPLQVVDQLHGPVLGLYAGLDKGIPQTDVQAMRDALKAKGDTKSELITYPDAQHGFNADYRANTYNEKDAKDGWQRLLAWFAKTL